VSNYRGKTRLRDFNQHDPAGGLAGNDPLAILLREEAADDERDLDIRAYLPSQPESTFVRRFPQDDAAQKLRAENARRHRKWAYRQPTLA
jgi:hypothetical protein